MKKVAKLNKRQAKYKDTDEFEEIDIKILEKLIDYESSNSNYSSDIEPESAIQPKYQAQDGLNTIVEDSNLCDSSKSQNNKAMNKFIEKLSCAFKRSLQGIVEKDKLHKSKSSKDYMKHESDVYGLSELLRQNERLERIISLNQPSPERIKALKRFLRKKHRKNKSKKKRVKIDKKEIFETPFLPKVVHKHNKKKHKNKSKPKKAQGGSPIKEFEPFKIQSTYNKYLSNNIVHKQTQDPVKLRSLVSGSGTEEYTSPSLPSCLSRGVVPSPLDYESIPREYKTKSTMMFESKPHQFKDSSFNSREISNPKSSRAYLYVPGGIKSPGPKVFNKLVLNSHRERLPKLK